MKRAQLSKPFRDMTDEELLDAMAWLRRQKRPLPSDGKRMERLRAEMKNRIARLDHLLHILKEVK